MDIESMTDTERCYFGVNVFAIETENGGLSEFFDDEVATPSTVEEGLAAMRASWTAAILREAVAVGRSGWAELDKRLTEDRDDLWGRMEAFAVRHRLYDAPLS
jgi:hypothetical protein